MDRSIYFNDWQACLRAHYVHVIRTNDAVTEPTLRHVLLQTGLTDADLDAIAAEARGLDPLPPDTPFDPAVVEAETAAAAELPADAPIEETPVETEILVQDAIAETVEDVDEIAPADLDAADVDEIEPDLPYDDAPYPDATGEVEIGYDEGELDESDLDER